MITRFDKTALLEKGERCIKEKQYEEAIEVFKKLLQDFPKSVLFQNELGVALRDAGEQEEAILRFKIALKLVNKDSEKSASSIRNITVNIARAYQLLGERKLKELDLFSIGIERNRLSSEIIESFKKACDLLLSVAKNEV